MLKHYTLVKLAVFIIFAMSVYNVRAAHIVGGEMVYRCLGSNSVTQVSKFEIIMTMYRDLRSPNGANFDTDAFVGVFRGSGSNWALQQSLTLNHEEAAEVGYESECIELPPNIGVEKAVYRFTIDLAWSDQNYLIAYQRCCRNGTISNIVDPGGTGAVFSVEITPTAQRICNNSPEFKKFPPIVICVNQALKFDHSASDKEGHTILYEFCSPQASGGKDGDAQSPNPGNPNTCTGVKPKPEICMPPFGFVQFNVPSFSEINPVGGNPQVSIDPLTGLISGTPNVIGQFVVGVCAKEYLGTELISTIRRDFQFNVTTCKIAVQADVIPDNSMYTDAYTEFVKNGKTINIKACGTKKIFLENLSTELKNIKQYKWVFNINNQEVIQTTKDAAIEFPSFGNYQAKLYLNPGSQECSDSLTINMVLVDRPKADFSFAYDTCVASTVMFTNKSMAGASSPISSYKWHFTPQDSANDVNPGFLFDVPGKKDVTIAVVDGNLCRDTFTRTINYFPVPDLIVIQPNQFIGCQPAKIEFTNLSVPIDSSYTVNWDFGDGTTVNEISPIHEYKDLGIYNVNLEIVSPIGCKTSRNYPELIEVLEKPVAQFIYSPEKPNSYQNEVFFTDQSSGASSWFWQFGDVGLAYIPNPKFLFIDTGVYEVILQVKHESGCTDTATAILDIVPITNLFMPNAFTPNNDGLNDLFNGIGLTDAVNYTMKIWNRWGELIFESKDPKLGWNGEKNNNGTLSPQGVYVYTISYISPRGEDIYKKGHLTLIR